MNASSGEIDGTIECSINAVGDTAMVWYYHPSSQILVKHSAYLRPDDECCVGELARGYLFLVINKAYSFALHALMTTTKIRNDANHLSVEYEETVCRMMCGMINKMMPEALSIMSGAYSVVKSIVPGLQFSVVVYIKKSVKRNYVITMEADDIHLDWDVVRQPEYVEAGIFKD